MRMPKRLRRLTKSGSALPPKVAIGGVPATVMTSEQTFGADHLTVELPTSVPSGVSRITAVRADGTAALGPGGSNGIALTIRDPPPSLRKSG